MMDASSGRGLRFSSIRKSYGSQAVLKDVNLTLERGRVHALLGPNGAGKSTLLGCLSGAVRADSGAIEINGAAYDHLTPTQSFTAGIGIIYQHFQIIGSLSCSDNMFLGCELRTSLGRTNYSLQRTKASEVLRSLGVNIDPDALVETLSVGEQQIVEIARALLRQPSVLVLDEPTAALSEGEVGILLRLVRRLADDHGLTVIYVTHLLREVMTVADKNQINKPAATPIKQNIRQQETKPLVKPAPPTSKAEAPPRIVPPEKPEPLKSEAKPTPAEDALAPPQKVIKKIEPKKLTPPKPVQKPDEKPKEEPKEDFQSAVLKNLIQNDTSKANDTAPVKENADPTPDAAQADQATMDQMAAAEQQLGECWKLLAGARYAEDLVVVVNLTMNADKTVANATIVDQARYNSDTFFRAAADSTLRAVYDPHCNPLQQLPDGKYDVWKTMTVHFDPKEMLQ